MGKFKVIPVSGMAADVNCMDVYISYTGFNKSQQLLSFIVRSNNMNPVTSKVIAQKLHGEPLSSLIQLARLVYEHHGNPVADGVSQLRCRADEFLPLGIIAQRLLGEWAHQDIE